MTRITGTLHEDEYMCFIVSHSVLLRMRNVLDKLCRENRNRGFIFSNFFFEKRAIYEIMWKIIVQPDRLRLTTRRMSITRWITKFTHTHTHTHTDYVILIAFPRQ